MGISFSTFVMFCMAIAAFSVSTAEGRPTKELRNWMKRRFPNFGGPMISCAFCFSHYVAGVATVYLAITNHMSLLQAFILWFALIGGAGVFGLANIGFLYMLKNYGVLVARVRKEDERDAALARAMGETLPQGVYDR